MRPSPVLAQCVVWPVRASADRSGTQYFAGKRRLRIPDQVLWDAWEGDPVKLVPVYVLDRIRMDEGKVVKLCTLLERPAQRRILQLF